MISSHRSLVAAAALTALLTASLVVLPSCCGECAPSPTDSAAAATAATTALSAPVAMHLAVKGMHCDGCEGAICGKVNAIAGVTACTASHVSESVDVTAPSEQRDAIVAAIKKLGYKIE